MFQEKKVIAIIPARKGSKRLPKKNTKLFLGRPLITYTLKQALSSKYLDEIYVTTNDPEIIEISQKYRVKIIQRPEELATDFAKMQTVLEHVLQNIPTEPDFIVLLQPTNPLRKTETIDKAIKTFIENSGRYDSLMPLKKIRLKKGKIIKDYYVPENKTEIRGQDLEKEYQECGTIFIYKSFLVKNKILNNEKIMPFLIEDYFEAIDIDNLEDFYIAESIKRRFKN